VDLGTGRTARPLGRCDGARGTHAPLVVDEAVEPADLALDLLEGGLEVDLACVDWNMPVLDGLQFVTRVRANPLWRAVTLVMVTTESEHSQIVRALAAGAHEYVIKPFTADALREKLELLGLVPEPVAAGGVA